MEIQKHQNANDWVLDAESAKTRADDLIAFMLSVYGEKFKRQYSGQSPAGLKKVWGPLLARLTDQQMAKGIEICATKPWPPTLPEFLSFCAPSVEHEAAYHEAIHCLQQRMQGLIGDWTHPAIYYAAATMASDILSNSYAARRIQWARALDAELAKGQWEPIPTPPLQLQAQQSAKSSAAQSAEIVKMVAEALEQPKSEGIGWARRILENPQGKAPATIRAARIAINGGQNG